MDRSADLSAAEAVDAVVGVFALRSALAGAVVAAQLPADARSQLFTPAVIASTAHADSGAAVLVLFADLWLDAVEELWVAALQPGAVARVGSDGLTAGVFGTGVGDTASTDPASTLARPACRPGSKGATRAQASVRSSYRNVSALRAGALPVIKSKKPPAKWRAVCASVRGR